LEKFNLAINSYFVHGINGEFSIYWLSYNSRPGAMYKPWPPQTICFTEVVIILVNCLQSRWRI
jgi:hypothetical protein